MTIRKYVRFATQAEALAGSLETVAISPATLDAVVTAGTPAATTDAAGLVELATQAEAEAGASATVVPTALGVAQAIAALGVAATAAQPNGYVDAEASGVNVNGAGVVVCSVTPAAGEYLALGVLQVPATGMSGEAPTVGIGLNGQASAYTYAPDAGPAADDPQTLPAAAILTADGATAIELRGSKDSADFSAKGFLALVRVNTP